MKSDIISIAGLAAMAAAAFGIVSCDDDVSQIGASIFKSEVSINVDSNVYDLEASTVESPYFATRSDYTMLGRIDVREYGRLHCSYVTRLLPAESISLPEGVTSEDVDSVKLVLTIPRSGVTGDSLAPQQAKAYALTSPLPDDITYDFNPSGYYNPSAPLSTRNYNLSGFSTGASSFHTDSEVKVEFRLDRQLGVDAVRAYAENPGLFVWPAEFAARYPGIYVEPSFGAGCLAAVASSRIYAYYPVAANVVEKDENGDNQVVVKNVPDSICLFSTAPEVLSSINIDYTPSDALLAEIESGKNIITTPGGYVVRFRFPAEKILEEYWSSEYNLGIINNLTFSLPARKVDNPYGIAMPGALLMVRTSDLDAFFSEGRVPDNVNAFSATYSASTGSYAFSSMRQYIVNLRAKGKENITADDVDFTLIPVNIKTEEAYINNQKTTIVTRVTPFVTLPTMVELLTDQAKIEFTYSNQIIK